MNKYTHEGTNAEEFGRVREQGVMRNAILRQGVTEGLLEELTFGQRPE